MKRFLSSIVALTFVSCNIHLQAMEIVGKTTLTTDITMDLYSMMPRWPGPIPSIKNEEDIQEIQTMIQTAIQTKVNTINTAGNTTEQQKKVEVQRYLKTVHQELGAIINATQPEARANKIAIGSGLVIGCIPILEMIYTYTIPWDRVILTAASFGFAYRQYNKRKSINNWMDALSKARNSKTLLLKN